MKVIAICGSARKNGNTARLTRVVLDELGKTGIETSMIELAGKRIRGCTACMKCKKRKDGHCSVTGDCVNECIDAMVSADGIILASPTYFADVSAELKAVIDRAGYVNRANDDMLRRKVGAAVVAVRRAGAMHAFDTINHFFTIGQMFIVGSSYWNIGFGGAVGEVERDEEGLATMRTLGENMGWLLHKLHGKQAPRRVPRSGRGPTLV